MKDKPTRSTQSQQRVIRVFVSSTFLDMRAERDELVKYIFPQLRNLCAQRGVAWKEVDLRWGVTDEQKAEGKVLPICLAEIHRSRPYFIGLLGERYGSMSDEIPQELIEQEPWLEEYLNHSNTELEILHGVLRNPEMAEHAFFYFRDKEASCKVEERLAKEKDYKPESEEFLEKLRGLKNKIKDVEKCGFLVCKNFPGPKALGALILKDLTEIINTRYPEGYQPEPLDRDAADHEAFAQSRAQVYIEREEYFTRLDEYVKSNEPPLVVLGESGSGKSALLANWGIKYREKHPDILFIQHFIGATPYSTDWAGMVRRIMGEFKRRFDFKEDIPDKPEELRIQFANWLSMAAVKGKVILILDALNQLEDKDQAPDLIWLPPKIPDNIRLILSTLPGRPLENLTQRDWPIFKVILLNKEERTNLIVRQLEESSRSLDKDLLNLIVSSEHTANPLYLNALLEELRVFGIHEKLKEYITGYLKTQTIPELYQKILARYETDYNRDRPGLVCDAMSFIWAARRGLSEAELMDLLGTGDEPLQSAYWSPMYLAAEQSLVSRSGLIGFAHDYFRQAVRKKYLFSEKEQNNAHLRIAGYFDERRLELRAVDELPYQLSKAYSYKRLYHLLSDLPFFEKAWNVNQFEVKGYWAQIQGNSGLTMTDAYRPIIDAPKTTDPGHVGRISFLLSDTGHLEEAFSLREHLVNHYREKGDTENLQASLGNQASILYARGDLDWAMELYKEQERLCKELGNKLGLARSMAGQALILADRGELDRAMELHKEEEQICTELGDKEGIQASLCNQAIILKTRGELDQAMELHKEEERICRELGSKDGLQRTLGNQALILQVWGRLEEAMKLHKEQERICRELGNKHSLSFSLGDQALILKARGDLGRAMELYNEQECLCRELGNKHGLSISLGNKAVILYARGDLDWAMELHKEEECLCRELGYKDGLSYSLGNQALILYARGELDRAMELHKEKECLCRELGNKDGLSYSLGNQALILYARGDIGQAMDLYKEQERICRELGNKYGLSSSLGNQAIILKDQGELDEAMRLYKESERICRELGNKEGLARSLVNKANLLTEKMGRTEEALPLAKEAYRMAIEHGYNALAQQIKPILDSVRSKMTDPKENVEIEAASGSGKGIECPNCKTINPSDVRKCLKCGKVLTIEKIEKAIGIDLGTTCTVSAIRESEIRTESIPGGFIDKVHFSVTSPPIVTPGSSFILELWAHLEQQREVVIQRAQEAACSNEIKIQSQGPVKVSRGTILSVYIEIKGFKVDDPKSIILWEGEIGNARFLITVPKDAQDGHRHGIVHICVNGLRIAKLYFQIQVSNETMTAASLPVKEERCQKAFASYASEDRDDVLARIQGIQKASPKLKVFFDVISLRSGQAWEQELWKEIPTNDIFYLFWSANAIKSKWVEKEWRCALETKGIDFIDPVPLVSPNEAPPPPELASKHFNDWVLPYMRSKQV